MVFCNNGNNIAECDLSHVTILILIDGFLQFLVYKQSIIKKEVTILILIDGFLQFIMLVNMNNEEKSHNPYFNRWFSAI